MNNSRLLVQLEKDEETKTMKGDWKWQLARRRYMEVYLLLVKAAPRKSQDSVVEENVKKRLTENKIKVRQLNANGLKSEVGDL